MEIIPASFYSHIYIILISFLSFATFYRYVGFGGERFWNIQIKEEITSTVILTIFLVLFIGFRPLSGEYFVDMANYASEWNGYFVADYKFSFDVQNILFDNLRYWMASEKIDVRVFFVLIAAIYFIGIALTCAILFPKDVFPALLVYLAAFSTFSYATNGIKAGAAASLFLVALAFNDKGKKLWTIIFLLLSWGFHHSMQLPVVAFFACKIVKNPKYYMWFWCFSFFMALAHIGFFQNLFAEMTDEHGADYLLGTGESSMGMWGGGFRIDFILYGATPIIIGYIALKKKFIQSERYEFLLNVYTLTNSVFMLCMYAEFNNRIAYLSWFMLPIVLIYPLLREPWGGNQYIVFRGVAYGHLSFTLLMTYIYYVFIHI